MKKVSILLLFINLSFFATAQQKKEVKSKNYSPYSMLLQPGTIIIINQKIFDYNSEEARKYLRKLDPSDSSKSLKIINDTKSTSTIKHIIIITEKDKTL